MTRVLRSMPTSEGPRALGQSRSLPGSVQWQERAAAAGDMQNTRI